MVNVVSLVALFLCVVFISAQDPEHWINDESEIAKINSLSHEYGWEAGINERFNDITHEQAKKLLGLSEAPRKVSETEARDVRSAQGVPSWYDARTKYPGCVMPVRDQGSCGACWSFAGSTAFGYRMCIQSGSRVKIDMSPQVGIDCNTAQNACNGGTLGGTWEYFKKSGTIADSDYPYVAKKNACRNTSVRRYYAASYTRPSTVAQMQEEIYNNGPIQVGFDVYSDLYSYKSGVYSRTASATLAGGHSVVFTGWGTDSNGVDYWIAVNSWGSRWGMAGAFYIRRGVNMCNIEKGYMPVSGSVAASSIPAGSTPTTTTTRAPSVTTTTRAPSSGGYDTRGCWTCPAGYIHWFMAGMSVSPGGDACACVTYSGTTPTTTTRAPTTTTRSPTPTTTTRAPSSGSYDTRGCWTCPAGYIHWFMTDTNTVPSDACACVPYTGATPTTTTRAPTATTTQAPANSGSYDTRGCWTCPAGWIHWFMTGLQSAPGGDRCACVRNPSVTTTRAPSTPTTASPTKYDTRGCWTCPAGYIHWFMTNRSSAPGGDKCACVVNSRRSLYSHHMPL